MTAADQAPPPGQLLSADGNRFVLVDLRARPVPDLAALARAAAARAQPALDGARVDGLLALLAPRAGGDLRLVIHNADGGRPETCGNGLRCVARYERDRYERDPCQRDPCQRDPCQRDKGLAREELAIETDAGPCAVRFVGRRREPSVHLGPGRLVERRVPLEVAGQRFEATLVDMGNPHAVCFVERPRAIALQRVGPAVEHAPRFPAGTNVEFARRRGREVEARVWERGVGETGACGSGACAIAVACDPRTWPLRVRFPGGVLVVERGDGGLWLRGSVERHGGFEWLSRGAHAGC
jgi:diaminopimelate epimerase